jgi:hypothetical protein
MLFMSDVVESGVGEVAERWRKAGWTEDGCRGMDIVGKYAPFEPELFLGLGSTGKVVDGRASGESIRARSSSD